MSGKRARYLRKIAAKLTNDKAIAIRVYRKFKKLYTRGKLS